MESLFSEYWQGIRVRGWKKKREKDREREKKRSGKKGMRKEAKAVSSE